VNGKLKAENKKLSVKPVSLIIEFEKIKTANKTKKPQMAGL
jgi:hypothetical protein